MQAAAPSLALGPGKQQAGARGAAYLKPLPQLLGLAIHVAVAVRGAVKARWAALGGALNLPTPRALVAKQLRGGAGARGNPTV